MTARTVCKRERYDRARERERTLRRKAERDQDPRVQLIAAAKAGGCAGCGAVPAEERLDGLHMHHVDPATKRFNVNVLEVLDRPLHEVRDELERCVPLCQPCHYEAHRQLMKEGAAGPTP